MTKLNQIIAVEKGIRNRADAAISKMYKLIQKPDLFAGMSRTYKPKDDEGDRYPSESVLVQNKTTDVLDAFARELAKIADVVLEKEWANQAARGTFKIGTTEYNVPVTYLLFMEKWLGDVHVFVDKLPELEPDQEWTFDAASGTYKNAAQDTKKTKKVPRVLVKFEPTDKHPGQSDTWYEDVLEGYWTTQKLSGKIPPSEKQRILRKLEAAIDAVKKAREEANQIETTNQTGFGDRVLEELLFND